MPDPRIELSQDDINFTTGVEAQDELPPELQQEKQEEPEIREIAEKAEALYQKVKEMCDAFGIDTNQFNIEGDSKLKDECETVQKQASQQEENLSQQDRATRCVTLMIGETHSDDELADRIAAKRSISCDKELPLFYIHSITNAKNGLNDQDGDMVNMGHANYFYPQIHALERALMTEQEIATFKPFYAGEFAYTGESGNVEDAWHPSGEVKLLKDQYSLIILNKKSQTDDDIKDYISWGKQRYNGNGEVCLDVMALLKYKEDVTIDDQTFTKLETVIRDLNGEYKNLPELDKSVRSLARFTAHLAVLVNKRIQLLLKKSELDHADFTYVNYQNYNMLTSPVMQINPDFRFSEADKIQASLSKLF